MLTNYWAKKKMNECLVRWRVVERAPARQLRRATIWLQVMVTDPSVTIWQTGDLSIYCSQKRDDVVKVITTRAPDAAFLREKKRAKAPVLDRVRKAAPFAVLATTRPEENRTT